MSNEMTKNKENKLFILWNRFTEAFFLDQNKSSRRKLFNTLWAVLFGFFISGMVIVFAKQNPFAVFASLFNEGTTTYGNKLISVFMGYLIASLSVAICFKSGLFNIGISGQMMIGGFTTLIIFRSNLQITHGSVFLALFVAILSGALVAFLAGLLKTTFGINEVVSTIMINWIIFFLIKFLVQDLKGFISDTDSLANNLSLGYIMPNFYQPQDLDNSWYANNWNWIIICIGLSLTFCLWWVISKTSFGYKIKMVGLNKNVADYSGTNKNALVLIVMSISGGLSGLAGFIWYIGQGGQIDIAEQPLLAGFDSIAISLLAYNSPIGIIVSSLIYGIMNVGSSVLPTEFIGMPKEMNEIIIGLMVYIAAVSVIFSKLNIYEWIRRFFVLSRIEKYRISKVDYWCSKFRYLSLKMSAGKEIFMIKKVNKYHWKKIKAEYKKQIEDLKQQLIKKYQNKMKKDIDVKLMSNDDQIYYFDKLSKLRLEKNLKLASYNYFEKNNIRARVIEINKKQKEKYNKVKYSILKKYEIYVYWKKMLRKYKFFKVNQIEFEKILSKSWKELDSLNLTEEIIFQKRVSKLKNNIASYLEKKGVV